MSKNDGIHVRGIDELCPKKRERSQNYLKEEKDNLFNIAEEYKFIIDNKKTDTLWASEKTKTWMEIAAKYNRTAKTGIRSGEQLKQLYKGLKKKYKKPKPDENGEAFKTVELPTPQSTQIDDRIITMLGHQLCPLDSIYDNNAYSGADNHGYAINLVKAIVKLPSEEQSVDVTAESTKPSTSYSTSVPIETTRSPNRISPQTSKKLEERTKFMERVKERQIPNTLETNSTYATQVFLMKKERHAKKMEILELMLKKETAELELKQLELKKRKENL